VGAVRERSWRNDWVLDLDIKGFFDNISHELMPEAAAKHTEEKWVRLFIERWLKAPIETREGAQSFPVKGTPQGGVISPLLANLFLHYAFDKWMEWNFPEIQFARYADDVVCHCKSEAQAEMLKQVLIDRMTEVGLELHAKKTKIVYCQDENRKQSYPCIGFDFLGYTFRARRSKSRYGGYFANFSPAISKKAEKDIRQEIRWRDLHLRRDKSFEELAEMYNAKIQGWINYYGRYSKSELRRTLRILDGRLTRWAMRKYKRLKVRGGGLHSDYPG
jgi:RNA-directed DNA polymerase